MVNKKRMGSKSRVFCFQINYKGNMNMDYKYNIISTDGKQHWIFLKVDEWDLEEIDTFEYMINKISRHINGEIIDIGDGRYKVANDPCDLIY